MVMKIIYFNSSNKLSIQPTKSIIYEKCIKVAVSCKTQNLIHHEQYSIHATKVWQFMVKCLDNLQWFENPKDFTSIYKLVLMEFGENAKTFSKSSIIIKRGMFPVNITGFLQIYFGKIKSFVITIRQQHCLIRHLSERCAAEL